MCLAISHDAASKKKITRGCERFKRVQRHVGRPGRPYALQPTIPHPTRETGQKKGAQEDALDDENCHNGLEQHAFSWGFENRDFSLKLAWTIGAGT
jgi:hypothetical protein